MENLHKANYKDYFKDVDFNYLLLEEDIKNEQNDDIKKELKRELEVIEKDNKTKIKSENDTLSGTNLLSLIINPISPQEHRFSLKIAYPGLVTGIGINHEAKIEGEFKLGVHFDYTWGMPVVYGSSVKGVLKSAFENGYVDDELIQEAKKIWENRKKSDKSDKKDKPFPCKFLKDPNNFKKIIDDVFEGKNKSIYNRDIFFDAVITKADNKGRILCSDSITPHGDNPLKNPVPLTFMKIAAGCTMEFRFKLVDSIIDGNDFTAEHKKALFEEIIKTVGVGAKTNVGYGQFE